MSIQARFHHDIGTLSLDVDVNLESKGVTALFGPSGAGKTSLLRAIAGLDAAPGGQLLVDGETWQDDSAKLPVRRRGVGYVFQEPSLFDHLDVRGNLHFARQRAPAGKAPETETVAQALGLEALLNRRIDRLSGGEKQRVALARTLLSAPRLLLLDEPLSSLDRPARQDILPYLESLLSNAGIPVVYVSHDLDEVARLADHMLIMNNGRITAQGPLADILADLDGELAHGDGAEVVWPAEVLGHDDDWQLTDLSSAAGLIRVPRQERTRGAAVRLLIHARDVSLTLAPQAETSILNILEARVMALAEDGPGQAMVRLDLGDLPLLARVTRKSAAELDLKAGATVFAQIKSVALLS